jgi:hypothetical protein
MKVTFTIAAMAGIACAALSMPGCVSRPSKAADYFPLKQGMIWTFRFAASGGANGKLTTTNLAPEKLYGHTVVPQENTGGASAYREYYMDDGTGIRDVAIENAQGLSSRMDDHAYVIKAPVRIGTAWREVARTLDGSTFDAKTTIESTSDKVSVPAGTFSGCVRVRSTGTASPVKHVSMGRRVSEGEIRVEEYYWLTPAVGPVKAVHQETAGEGAMARSVGISLELESFKQ